MTDVHPNWQAEEETPVAVRIKNTEHNGVREISRRPAAIVGMLVVIGIGTIVFKGMDALQGQVVPSPQGPTVILADGGFVPNRLEVEHGQTITFINQQTTPQSIRSETLCNDTGFCLNSPMLSTGESTVFSITPDMNAGPFEFTASDGSKGIAVLVTNTVDDFIGMADVVPQNIFEDAPTAKTIAAPAIQTTIPTNPYTVDTVPMQTYTESYVPMQMPLRQPETGAESWIVFVLSTLCLWYITRGLFARTA